MHRLLIAVGSLIYLSTFTLSWAGECKDNKCPFPTRKVCFNMLCTYKSKDDKGYYENCRAAARFNKLVREDGKEVRDTSKYPFNPEFEVECNRQIIFNDSGLRFTDELGTRIQAEPGPFPAILLPKNALREGHRYALSTLELEGQILHGQCYIYSTTYMY